MLLKNIQTKERDEKKLGIKKIKQLRSLVQDEKDFLIIHGHHGKQFVAY